MTSKSAISLSPEVKAVLERSVIGVDSVKLPQELDRKLYLAVNKVLEAAGGKWSRKAQSHLFVSDPRQLLGLAVSSGAIIDKKKALQAFYTPAPLADRVVALASLKNVVTCRVLEPSAGHGAIAEAVKRAAPKAHLTCWDIDSSAWEVLKQKFPNADVECVDFLKRKPLVGFQRIVMNPPFTRGQDIEHVMHAAGLLVPKGGVLVAIVSAGALSGSTRKHQNFKQMLEVLSAEVFDVEDGAFTESGTEVKTKIVRVRT